MESLKVAFRKNFVKTKLFLYIFLIQIKWTKSFHHNIALFQHIKTKQYSKLFVYPPPPKQTN